MSIIDSQTIQFVKQTKSDCPNCLIDPTTGISTDPTCPTCKGKGYILTDTSTSVIVNVDYGTDGYDESIELSGRNLDGQVTITANAQQLIDQGFKVENFLLTHIPVDYFLIDGKKFLPDYVQPEKLNGTIYELVIRAEVAPGMLRQPS